ncbi:MAG TPA: hypothetical protein VF982_10455 [Anaerolineales bacterium]
MERPRNPEEIHPGQLYFLAHPGSELFSGYGLTTQEGRQDRLIGLLMVDRPRPVDPAWLAEIDVRYGDYQLIPMTATGERGLVTQMRIAPESLAFLGRFSGGPLGAVEHEFARVLQPLLDNPPAPILKLRWSAEQHLWTSAFWQGLPPEMQAVFEQFGDGCFAAERADHTVAFITHAKDADIDRFHRAPVRWQWELIPMPTAPLIRFRAAILDKPSEPYVLEHFLNLADPEQARCLARLVNQKELTLDFYGQDYEYAYSKQLAHPAERRQDLQEIVRWAIEYYGSIPAHARDFDRAKALFQRYFSV